MTAIEAALVELRSLEPDQKPNFTQTAKKHGCDRSNLAKRYRGLYGSKEARSQNQRLLNDQQEKSLIKYIDGLLREVYAS